jgi:t-SNARE complex subunit (syntaxin)
MSELELITPTDAQRKARKSRSFALGIALVAIVFVFYGITLFRMGGGQFG